MRCVTLARCGRSGGPIRVKTMCGNTESPPLRSRRSSTPVLATSGSAATSPTYGDITYIFGQTDAGRALIVVLTDAVDGRDFVVTARDMTDTERRLYERRGR